MSKKKISPNIVIVDYGVGNLHSLCQAFKHSGIVPLVTYDPETIKRSDAVVLPGVGSFEAGMCGLKKRKLIDTIVTASINQKPILGICLGAQVMLDVGYEFGTFNGLGLIPGKVIRFPKLNSEKIPHVGWNSVYKPTHISWKGTILQGLKNEFETYFVHSYVLVPSDKKYIYGLTSYGGHEFCSVIKKGNTYGCQFHPEKSGPMGLSIIDRFIKSI
ncbi:MAG: imidazole glycerol phosphate synthase subunit HisH [bacterium]|nr:imidazole glycerol phosphate synthase subunit HisH [bacterium]